MEKLTRCKSCGEEIAKSARVCPKCGARRKIRKFPIVLGVIAILIAVFTISEKRTNSKAITIIKEAYLSEYPEKPIGEAVEEFFVNSKWDAGTSKDSRIKAYLINCKGAITYKDSPAVAIVQFQLDGDTGVFQVRAIEVNNNALTVAERTTFLNALFGKTKKSDYKAGKK